MLLNLKQSACLKPKFCSLPEQCTSLPSLWDLQCLPPSSSLPTTALDLDSEAKVFEQ